MLSNGITMAQSPGDHNSRGLCLLQITTQKILSLGKLSRLVHSRRGGFVTCCGLRVLRALRVLGRWWFSWATAGARPCVTLTPPTLPDAFPRLWIVRSLQQKRTMCSRVPTFIAPRAHVMPSTWRLPHWIPRGWRQPRGDLAGTINASARAPS